MQTFLIKNRFFSSIALVSVLSACGGGDDEPVAPAPAPPPVVSVGVPASTIATPPSLTTDPEGFTNPGTLQYLAFAADGTTSVDPASITYGSPNGTLAFGSATATTNNDWSSVAWSGTGITGGRLAFNGNAAIACSGNQLGDAEVFISANMTPVVNTAALLGATFDGFDCESAFTLTYNTDGTITATYPGSPAEVVSASQTAALFTTDGLTDPDGSNFKARVFSITIGGVTRHAIVVIGRDCINPSSCSPTAMEISIQRP
jgi:hypothetical protein